jgi:EAL domain-containing protein (putative c-di-GMP-specific phosphodiesterase class I)
MPTRDIREAAVTDLPYAIRRGQLAVLYQPLIHLPSLSVAGFEALLRWRHPQYGPIAPDDFIPVAEETGWIIPLGEWVLRQACEQLNIWQTKFPHHARLSMNVNLSVRQLADPQLSCKVARVLAETGVAPEAVALELTEGSLVSEMNSARQTLERLRALGVRLKLDDFGTGYSSLSYLGALRFDALKIDRSFVHRMLSDPASDTIMEAIIQLAHKLRMKVVAEGIETEAQLRRLVELGCNSGQGFLFSRPLPAELARQMLAETSATQDLRALGSILKTCSKAYSLSQREPGAEMRSPLFPATHPSPVLLRESSFITLR